MPDTALHPLRRALTQFWTAVPWMLEAAIVLEIVLGKYLEAAIIACLLVFNAALGFFQEGHAQATLAALKARLALNASVRRDGGWKIVPAHFVDRHSAIVIIALGESIVALGVGARTRLGGGIVTAAVLGVRVAAMLWWVYFDIAALVAGRRLARAKEGRERNEIARDAYSYLHFPMVAGIALVAVLTAGSMIHIVAPIFVTVE